MNKLADNGRSLVFTQDLQEGKIILDDRVLTLTYNSGQLGLSQETDSLLSNVSKHSNEENSGNTSPNARTAKVHVPKQELPHNDISFECERLINKIVLILMKAIEGCDDPSVRRSLLGSGKHKFLNAMRRTDDPQVDLKNIVVYARSLRKMQILKENARARHDFLPIHEDEFEQVFASYFRIDDLIRSTTRKEKLTENGANPYVV